MDINKIKADHPFLNYDHKEYFEEFLKRISSLKHIMSSNIEAKVEEKMKYKDEASFWQSIAEIIIWFLCESKEKDYMIDYPTKGGKNCDVSFLIDDMRINIEVKCPQIIVDRKQINYDATKMILQPILPYRYEITRNEVESVYDEIEREFKNTGLGIAPIEFPDDNPLFQAIAKASEQLPDLDDKTYNIVFISTIQSQMEKYWRYLTNTTSGVLNPSCGKFIGNGNHKWKLDKEVMKNISAIVISDIISHNQKFNVYSWDLAKSFNLILGNTNSIMYEEYLAKVNELRQVNNFIPNETNPFFRELLEYKNYLQETDNGIEDDMIPSFIFNDVFKRYLKKRKR